MIKPISAVSAQADRHRPLADHSTDRRMILLAFASLFVGTGGVFGAWILLKLIAVATNAFWFSRLSAGPADIADAHGWAVVFIPIIGGLIIGLMARFGSEKIRGHGIPEAIEAILYGESRLSLKVAILKPLSSAVSIGSGGPFGAEGPIIMTGGALGSLFAQCFHLSAAERKTLLVAGAAAGMTGIFGTPIAAILLAVEVLLFEWKPRSFVPVVVGALIATAWRPWLIGDIPLFPFASPHAPDPVAGLAIAFGIGLLTGCQAALLSLSLYRIEDLFHRLPIHWMWWPAIGAIVVGLGGLVDAHVLGAGYGNIQSLLDGSLVVRAVLSLLLVKALVWLVALGSGTSGGVLAPLLIQGGALGYLAGLFLPGSPGLWAMIGMAGMMSGAMRAPLTGALFAAELTGHLTLLPMTMAAAAGAFAVSVLAMRRSILTEKIARRGRHVRQEYAVDPHELLQAGAIMTAPAAILHGNMPVADAVAFFAGPAEHRSYPVIAEDGRLVGLASRIDALRWQSEGFEPDDRLTDILSDVSQPAAFPHTPIGEVADLMLDTGIGRIPIVSPDNGHVLGMLSRHDLLKARSIRRDAEDQRSRR